MNTQSHPFAGAGIATGRSASIAVGRDDGDAGFTLLRVFDFALIAAMVVAPFLLTTAAPR